jgi:DNA-binding transcriptional regulator GbsR (MarR family)
MAENERDFKGVWITKEVWLDERLNALDKVILTEIDSLDRQERGCYASNKSIADFCQCSETKVSTAISKLINLGYIYVQKFDGRQRELKSRLSNFERQNFKNCKADIKNLKDNNTDNNINNNKERKKEISKSQNSFDEIFKSYTQNEETLRLLGEWLKVRKAKRAAMTDYSIRLNLNKLETLAKQSNLSVNNYLKEVIARGWQAFYPIKNFETENNKQPNDKTYSGYRNL